MTNLSRSLAVVGCGAVVEEAYDLALAGLAVDGWNLLFCDSHTPRARQLASRFKNAEALPSLDALAGRTSHAIVATPPASHFGVCSRLINAGIHVLCEKPFVLDPAEGQVLVAAAAAKGLKLQVNQTRRWYPASITAKRLLREGAIGEVCAIRARDGVRFNWPAKTAFHAQPGVSRNGILSDQGAHVFDMLAWILGQDIVPTSVLHDGYAGPETTARVVFRSDRLEGEAVMTWLLGVPTSVQFIGSKGRLTMDGDCNHAFLESNGTTRELFGEKKYFSYSGLVQSVVEAFVHGADLPSVANAHSVLPSIRFLDQAYRIGKAELSHATVVKSNL